ncbi:hypothetical protein ACTFIZ_009863 [Dictyostelium cf. discoideum]
MEKTTSTQYEVKVHYNDAILNYAIDHSDQLTEIQKQLIQFTKANVERHIMLTQAEQCSFFKLLIQILNAKKTIDIGVFTGLSSLTAALAMGDEGRVVACDVSTDYTQHALKFWAKAGVDHKINLKIQPASQTLQELIDQGEENTYDFVFIDADKTGYDTYYELSLKLIRKGGIIAIDNVLQQGGVIDQSNSDPNVVAIRALNDKILADKRVTKTMLPIADGITLVTKIN